MIDVLAVNRKRRIAILDTDEIVQFTTLLDGDGDETDDMDHSVFAVGQMADGRWLVVDISAYDNTATH